MSTFRLAIKNYLGALTLAFGLAGFLGSTGALAADCKGLSKSRCASNSACTWVKGYKTSSGKSVDSYCRAKPKKGAGSTKKSDKKKSAATDKTTKSKATKADDTSKKEKKQKDTKKKDSKKKDTKKKDTKKKSTKKKDTKKKSTKKKDTKKKKDSSS